MQNLSDVCDAKLQMNIQRIEEKRREPSNSMELESLSGVFANINKCVVAANTKIKEQNMLVQNALAERSNLTNQVWRYLLDCQITVQLNSYMKRKRDLEKAIGNLNTNIAKKTDEKLKKEKEIIALERHTTTIQPTIGAINTLLKSFGFEGFVLARSKRDRFYEIKRPDGSDAKETLSEGERSFIAFPYVPI